MSELSGVVSGAALALISAWIGYRVKASYEERKRLNQALYRLLDLWRGLNLICLFDVRRFSAVYVDAIKAQLPQGALSPEGEQALNKIMHGAMPALYEEVLSPLRRSVSTRSFDESIDQLAEVTPVLADGLRSNRTLADFIRHFESVLQTLSAQAQNPSQSVVEDFQQARELLLGMMAKETIGELEKDIRAAAFKSGVLVWLGTLRAIRRQQTRLTNHSFDADLRRLVATHLGPVLRKHGNPKPSESN